MQKTVILSAGQRAEFQELSDFFRILTDTAGATFSVEFYLMGARVVDDAASVQAGYAERFLEGTFDKVVITPNIATTVTFVTRLGNDVRYDIPPTGQVTLQAGAFSHATATVTTTSATIKPASSLRRYLLVQNKDTAGTIFVRLDGVAATAATGITIAPGESLELSIRCPTGAVTAIGDIASNTNVLVVEG